MQKQSCRGLILMPILAGLWSSPTWSLLTTNAQQDAKDAEIERLRKENAVLQELVKKL
jgi:regulator of replication initiation timing